MGTTQKILLGVIAAVVVGYATMQVLRAGAEAPTSANNQTLMDSETGKLVQIKIRPGMGPYPHENPKTGKKTLYPTEICYANSCEQIGGTRVILNTWLGSDEPTTCPNCGAPVRVMNRSKSRGRSSGE